MNRDDIKNLFEYNDWANDILVDMLAAAFGEHTDLRTGVAPMVIEIQETAVHIVSALHIWRMRWQGTSLSYFMDPEPYATAQRMRECYHSERTRLWEFFNGLNSDECLNRVYAYTSTRGEPFEQPLAAMMQHVVNHSSYHRGQITARLMALGFGDMIVGTDFAAWTTSRNAICK